MTSYHQLSIRQHDHATDHNGSPKASDHSGCRGRRKKGDVVTQKI